VRQGSFRGSNQVAPLDQYPEVEVVKNPPEWKFVERLLSSNVIPQPAEKPNYPSGWQPQNIAQPSPYTISRTKNHMLPLYLCRTHRGQRRITKVRRIEGDIWALEADLRAVVEKRLQKRINTRVNEMSGQIELRGDFVTIVEEFLQKRGL
jgi:large subunit ribosomal protein L49